MSARDNFPVNRAAVFRWKEIKTGRYAGPGYAFTIRQKTKDAAKLPTPVRFVDATDRVTVVGELQDLDEGRVYRFPFPVLMHADPDGVWGGPPFVLYRVEWSTRPDVTFSPQ